MRWLSNLLARLNPAGGRYPGITDEGKAFAPNPFATVQGVLDVLEQRATARRDMTAVGRLQSARNIITRESLRHG